MRTKTVRREQAGRQRYRGECLLALSRRRPTSVGGAQPLSNSNSMSVEVRRPPTQAPEPVTRSQAHEVPIRELPHRPWPSWPAILVNIYQNFPNIQSSAGVPIWELEASSQWVAWRHPLGIEASSQWVAPRHPLRIEASSQWVAGRSPDVTALHQGRSDRHCPRNFKRGLQYICYRIFEHRGPVGPFGDSLLLRVYSTFTEEKFYFSSSGARSDRNSK